jgi:hypothetical protein
MLLTMLAHSHESRAHDRPDCTNHGQDCSAQAGLPPERIQELLVSEYWRAIVVTDVAQVMAGLELTRTFAISTPYQRARKSPHQFESHLTQPT